MTLKLAQDKLRFRLSPHDVDKLLREKQISSQVNFADKSLKFHLVSRNDIEKPAVQYLSNVVSVVVAEIEFLEWLNSSEIEFAFDQNNINVMIEKDLKPQRG